jgi:hypothetical protein
MVKSKQIIFIITLALSFTSITAQKSITRQNLIWYGYFLTLQFNEKWYWQTELQERHYINPTAQHQFLVRSHLHRSLGKSGWEASVGMSLFLQNPNDPEATVKLTTPELRPHIEFAYKQRLKHLAIEP